LGEFREKAGSQSGQNRILFLKRTGLLYGRKSILRVRTYFGQQSSRRFFILFLKVEGDQLLSPSRPFFFPHGLNRFRTLQKANKELQAALKLSRKRGRTQSDDSDEE
jgi:hypothetical protein